MSFPVCAPRTFTNIKVTYFLNKRELEYERGIQTGTEERKRDRNHRGKIRVQKMYGSTPV